MLTAFFRRKKMLDFKTFEKNISNFEKYQEKYLPQDIGTIFTPIKIRYFIGKY